MTPLSCWQTSEGSLSIQYCLFCDTEIKLNGRDYPFSCGTQGGLLGGDGNLPEPKMIDGQRSLVGYSPWGHKESYRTERLHFTSLQNDV